MWGGGGGCEKEKRCLTVFGACSSVDPCIASDVPFSSCLREFISISLEPFMSVTGPAK